MFWRVTLPDLPNRAMAPKLPNRTVVPKRPNRPLVYRLYDFCRRPRFSVRTLTMVMTVFCLYLGTWEMTKHCSVPYVNQYAHYHHIEQTSPAPFLVKVVVYKSWGEDLDGKIYPGIIVCWDFYLCFGKI